MATFLEQITAAKQLEITALKQNPGLAELERQAPAMLSYAPRAFHAAITPKKAPINLHCIAEIKKASPSKGIIREDFDPVAIAQDFAQTGASALSVLTETEYFKGNPAYITQIKKVVNLPILRKDFILDPIQVHESKKLGADAILLIKAILSVETLTQLMMLAHRVGLDTVVEVHNQAELDEVLPLGCPIIGINNRNLHTFEVDLNTTLTLADKLKYHHPRPVLIAESGYSQSSELHTLTEHGLNAVLIGEGLAKHPELTQFFKQGR